MFLLQVQQYVRLRISKVENVNVCTCLLLWLMYKVYWHHTFLIIDPPTQQNLENGALTHSLWPSGSFYNLRFIEEEELDELSCLVLGA